MFLGEKSARRKKYKSLYDGQYFRSLLETTLLNINGPIVCLLDDIPKTVFSNQTAPSPNIEDSTQIDSATRSRADIYPFSVMEKETKKSILQKKIENYENTPFYPLLQEAISLIIDQDLHPGVRIALKALEAYRNYIIEIDSIKDTELLNLFVREFDWVQHLQIPSNPSP